MNAMQALERAREAWQRTQPQLVIDGWAAGLDEQDVGASVLLVEPVVAPHAATTGGGLTSCGTEPRHKPGADGNQPLVSGRPFPCSGQAVGAATSSAGLMERGALPPTVDDVTPKQGKAA